MGQVLRGSARTTHAIGGELQRSQASVASLAKRYGINEKTVLKWRHRQSVEDLPMGPKERRSTVLSPMEEAAIVALRAQARLRLDDVYIALKDVIPHLTRSSLHRCLQRHGISRLPKADREKPKKCQSACKRDPYRRAKGTPFSDGARLIGHAPLRCARPRAGVARPEACAAQGIF
jgi:transposase